MRRTGLALALLFVGVVLAVSLDSVRAQIPSWVDNNPANAPRLPVRVCPCAEMSEAMMPECTPPVAAKPAHRSSIAGWLKSCRLAHLARRSERWVTRLCDPASRGCGGCGCCDPCAAGGNCGCGGNYGADCGGDGASAGVHCQNCAARAASLGDQASRRSTR